MVIKTCCINLINSFLVSFHGKLHANYSRNYFVDEFSDEYIAHRMVQLYEMGQFIQKNSHAADISFLLGDLNTNEFEHGFGMLMHQTNLLDAFKEKMVLICFFN